MHRKDFDRSFPCPVKHGRQEHLEQSRPGIDFKRPAMYNPHVKEDLSILSPMRGGLGDDPFYACLSSLAFNSNMKHFFHVTQLFSSVIDKESK